MTRFTAIAIPITTRIGWVDILRADSEAGVEDSRAPMIGVDRSGMTTVRGAPRTFGGAVRHRAGGSARERCTHGPYGRRRRGSTAARRSRGA